MKIESWMKLIVVVETIILAALSFYNYYRVTPDVDSTLDRVDDVIEKMDLSREDTPQWHQTRGALAECRALVRACHLHQ